MEEDQVLSWLPQKTIQCGRATGVMVDDSREGWTELIHFAQRREEQNRAKSGRGNWKAKRKGVRELNSLLLLIMRKARTRKWRNLA